MKDLDDNEYLRVIGAAGISKDDKRLYPTAAGMFIFGNEYDIVRCFPEYKMWGIFRIDDTPVHRALREAQANCITITVNSVLL